MGLINEIVGMDDFSDPWDIWEILPGESETGDDLDFVPHVWTHTFETPDEWM